MDSYKRNVYYSEDDKCWVAEIPELPGCMETLTKKYWQTLRL